MQGSVAKAVLTTMFADLWRSSGNKIKRLDVRFAGEGAGIRCTRRRRNLSATVILPAIDDKAEVSNELFNKMTGYVVHELGHAWFTDNEPWDEAKSLHGDILGDIINGLEDARTELQVIRSGYADNARQLLTQLTNNVFEEPFEVYCLVNVGAVCAIEGRRLNGYELTVPDLFLDNPWWNEIDEALADLQHCTNTADVVKVAVELWEKIKPEWER